MILGFGAKRREKRDQEAGLVFGWRRHDSTTLSTILALMCTSGIVVFSVYALRIPLEDRLRGRRDRATGVELFQITDQAPSHISQLLDDGVADRRDLTPALNEVIAVLDELTAYAPEPLTELRPLPRLSQEIELPNFIDPTRLMLPKPRYSGEKQPISQTGVVVLRGRGTGSLKQRIVSVLVPFDFEDRVEFYGQEVRAQVALRPSGAVESAWIIDPVDLSNPLAEAVQRWLPSQIFSAGGSDGIVWGEMIFSLKMEVQR